MKSLIKEMGLGQFLAMILVLCMIAFGVYDCSSGKTKSYSCEIVDREIRTHYDKDHRSQTNYYLYAVAQDGVHCVDVTRTQYYTIRLGEVRELTFRQGKLSKLIYIEYIK